MKANQQVWLTTLDARLVLRCQGYTPRLDTIRRRRTLAEEQKASKRQQRE